MVGACENALYFIQICAYNSVSCIFFRIDGTVLQCNVNLSPCKRSGFCADSGPECHMVVVFHGPDLKSFEILQSIQLHVSSSQTVSSILQNAQQLEAGSIVGGAQFLMESRIGAV